MAKIVSVGTTATRLLDVRLGRKEYQLQNQGSATIFLGNDENVAVSGTRTGRKLPAGAMESANYRDEPESIILPLYAIVASGTCNVWVNDR